MSNAPSKVGHLETENRRLRARVTKLEAVRDIAAGILGMDDNDRITEVKVHFNNRPSMYLQDALQEAIDAAERTP